MFPNTVAILSVHGVEKIKEIMFFYFIILFLIFCEGEQLKDNLNMFCQNKFSDNRFIE